MKKISAFLVVALVAVASFADMDNRVFTIANIGTTTNSQTFVLRGKLEAVKVDVTAPATNTVTITSGELTLFSKASIAADATYLPRAATHTTAGAAATFVGGTNDTANVWYATQPMAGEVTVTVVGGCPAATNNTIVTIIYDK